MNSADQIRPAELDELTEPIPREFFERPADVVARELLGTVLIHGTTAGMLVETEAYMGLDDLAAHASRGRTKRTEIMFGPAGHAYVYLIYGMHECFNVTAGELGVPHCVLVRALEPLSGLKVMAKRRGYHGAVSGLCNGPGKLTEALGITRKQYGADLCVGPLRLRRWKKAREFEVGVTARIGIRECADWPLRFLWLGNACVSHFRDREASERAVRNERGKAGDR